MPTQSINIRNLVAACSAISVCGLAFGMSYPLLSLILEARGVSAQMIGINAAMMPIGILLFSSVIPFIAQKIRARNLAIIAAGMTAVLLLCYKWFDSLEAWFILRLLQGMSISTLFVLSEAWIVRFAGDKHRGKVIAIYGSTLSASFGAGPAVISWLGIDGWLPFVIGAIVIVLGIIPLYLVDEESQPLSDEANAAGIFAFIPLAPMLLACVFAFAVLDAATLSLLPIYGLQYDLTPSTATLLLSALIIGNTVLQFPIGWLADRFPHRHVLIGCAAVTVLMMALLPMVMTSGWQWPVVIIAGTTGYGIYTVSLTALGQRFKGIQLINGAAAFAVMWGIGALLGSVSGGMAMSFGADGLPYHLALVYLLLVFGLCMRGYYLWRRAGGAARSSMR